MATASDELAERLTEPVKALEAARTEVALLKKQVVHADAEKENSEKVVAEIVKSRSGVWCA